MHTICVFGAKGGTGTSTVAATLALQLSTHVPTVLVDRSLGQDLDSILGLPHPHGARWNEVGHGALTLITGWDTAFVDKREARLAELAGNGPVVIDGGRLRLPCDMSVLVCRNDFLSLRHAMSGPDFDHVVLIAEPKRSLTLQDARDVLGVEPLVLDLDPAVARAIDAGLLASRIPRSLACLSGLAGRILDAVHT